MALSLRATVEGPGFSNIFTMGYDMVMSVRQIYEAARFKSNINAVESRLGPVTSLKMEINGIPIREEDYVRRIDEFLMKGDVIVTPKTLKIWDVTFTWADMPSIIVPISAFFPMADIEDREIEVLNDFNVTYGMTLDDIDNKLRPSLPLSVGTMRMNAGYHVKVNGNPPTSQYLRDLIKSGDVLAFYKHYS